ncbi:MAG: hypothetical protein ABIZ36_06460 [Gemmatimonadaceae bacterium]
MFAVRTDVTRLLAALKNGDTSVGDKVLPHVDHARREWVVARVWLRRELTFA